LGAVIRYIENQQKHHAKNRFEMNMSRYWKNLAWIMIQNTSSKRRMIFEYAAPTGLVLL